MPYTPPSQQSPASSKSASPNVSRKSSYSEEVPRSPVAGRPQPPRSSHSTSYLHRQRRSPSIAKADAPPTPTDSSEPGIHTLDFARSSSVRQSPPPINGLAIPTGAVISPPDSSENSDGDEAATGSRGRVLASNWAQLKEAVHAINQRRESSPDKGPIVLQVVSPQPSTETISPPALSAEARKISHSRSSTETAIILLPRNQSFESTTEPSDDSDDEDDGLTIKPSLVRKKSGELVKPALRPSSRRRYSSMPGTPTYSKSVHFNDSDNQTRHFLQVDKPIAVSAGTSPVETYESEVEYPFEEAKREREIKLANFPSPTFDRSARPVRLERLVLSSDRQTLIGTVAVQNISFQKLVVARFTLDYWKTTSEVVAEYSSDARPSTNDDGCDRFTFYVKLSDQANIDNKTLFLCVRYNVAGAEYWDNNDDINYQVDFIKAATKSERPVSPGGLGARPVSAIPRSRHSPHRRHESMDDDFASRIDSTPAYSFSADNLLGEGSGSVKLKVKRGRGSLFAANNEPSPGLGGRYDFGASLSAALSTAQDKLGRHSGLMNATEMKSALVNGSAESYFGLVDRKAGPEKAEERPDALTTDRPAMGSDQYKDLVQKFCYFTPGVKKALGTPPTPSEGPASAQLGDSTTDAISNHDGADSASAESVDKSKTPSSPGRKNSSISGPSFTLTSRPSSPGRNKSLNLPNRAPSPMNFGYPFLNSGRDGYLSDSSITPTAIHG